jgi:hypothetical protein
MPVANHVESSFSPRVHSQAARLFAEREFFTGFDGACRKTLGLACHRLRVQGSSSCLRRVGVGRAGAGEPWKFGKASKGLHRRRGWPISARSQSFCLAHVEFLPRSLLLTMLLCCKVCNLHMVTRYCTMALQSCENCARGLFLISGIKRSNALACHSLHIAGRWMY